MAHHRANINAVLLEVPLYIGHAPLFRESRRRRLRAAFFTFRVVVFACFTASISTFHDGMRASFPLTQVPARLQQTMKQTACHARAPQSSRRTTPQVSQLP